MPADPLDQFSPALLICQFRGVQLRWLANQLGVTLNNLHGIEAGRRPAPPGYREHVALLLGVPPSVLYPDLEPERLAS